MDKQKKIVIKQHKKKKPVPDEPIPESNPNEVEEIETKAVTVKARIMARGIPHKKRVVTNMSDIKIPGKG